MSREVANFRPQDVLVLARLIVENAVRWRQVDLARELGISQTELSFSLNRLNHFGLLFSEKKEIKKEAVYEFLSSAVKYLFPAEFSGVTVGIPTSISTLPLSSDLVNNQEIIVWPHSTGKVRGLALKPIYSTMPDAALKNSRLHEVLALIDAIRSNQGRVLELAKKRLKENIGIKINE
jgi:hypothetical protein